MNEDLIAVLDDKPNWYRSPGNIYERAATALRAADAEIARLTDERDELLDQVSEQEGLTDKYHAAITSAMTALTNASETSEMRNRDAYGHLSAALDATAPEPAALKAEPSDAERMGPAASCHLCVGAGGYEDHDGEWVECSCQRTPELAALVDEPTDAPDMEGWYVITTHPGALEEVAYLHENSGWYHPERGWDWKPDDRDRLERLHTQAEMFKAGRKHERGER